MRISLIELRERLGEDGYRTDLRTGERIPWSDTDLLRWMRLYDEQEEETEQ